MLVFTSTPAPLVHRLPNTPNQPHNNHPPPHTRPNPPQPRGDNAGIVGALTLAKVALDKKGSSSLVGRARGYLASHASALGLGALIGALAAAGVVVGGRRKG